MSDAARSIIDRSRPGPGSRGLAVTRRGQSVLYAVLLMPTLFLVLALAIDIAALQLDKLRLRYALDLAMVTAATAVDRNTYSQTGRLRLDPNVATTIARDYLLQNLSGLPDTPNPERIVAAADIAVVNQVPARDPYSGMLLDRPAICARIRVTHRFDLLGWVGMHAVNLAITSTAEIRT